MCPSILISLSFRPNGGQVSVRSGQIQILNFRLWPPDSGALLRTARRFTHSDHPGETSSSSFPIGEQHYQPTKIRILWLRVCLVCGLILKFFLQRERERIIAWSALATRPVATRPVTLCQCGSVCSLLRAILRLNAKLSAECWRRMLESRTSSIVEIKFAFD